ncbi:MAG: ATP-binding protein [Gammaproteobacteria bacterium]|nr:ATP-binding protein [Gammaproteobacteria bacterium]
MTANPHHPEQANKRLLSLLDSYRLLLTFILMSVVLLDVGDAFLGSRKPLLFLVTTALYAVTSVGFLLSIHFKSSTFEQQLWWRASADIVFIVALMHSSGGINSGLGMLLIISIAGFGILMSERLALLFAALASLAILAEQFYTHLSLGQSSTHYPQAGILGATLFATALLAMLLARRSRESEAHATQSQTDLKNMAQLNALIIEKMESAILVVDSHQQIRLANQSARTLLKLGHLGSQAALKQHAPRLHYSLNQWHYANKELPCSIKEPNSQNEIQPHFTPLEDQGWLISLQDTSAIRAQLQQLKLASLGHLSANIAHEIRNPLSAISHASQLLAESPHINVEEGRLLEIILDHGQRINRLIEDVMQISQLKKFSGQAIKLRPSLEQFAHDFCQQEKLPSARLQLHFFNENPSIYMESLHLHQVLWNLCCNSLKHGGQKNIKIKVESGNDPDTGQPFLDLCDNGHGVSQEQIDKLFEPFYTTSHSGTGLGLFMARELCRFNGASLRYLADPQGSRFRIVFNQDLDTLTP